ncbi:MAG: SprT family zinc-dependent metalloprotease [Candidatus Hadarchaeales archaeon]
MRRSSEGSERYRYIRVNGTDLPYSVVRRDVKYPRLEFKTGELVAVLPKSWKDETSLLDRKMDWISKKHAEIQNAVERFRSMKKNGRGLLIFGDFFDVSENGALEIDFEGRHVRCDLTDGRQLKRLHDILRKKLLSELESSVREYCEKFDVKPNRIFIKKQETKWASCSSRGNLSFNFWLICLPKELIRYVACHEVVHLKERHHNQAFWREMEKEFENYRDMEKKLFEYWFFVQEYSRSMFQQA